MRQPESQVDFALHHLARIRLIDPTPGDISAVMRQLGPIRGSFKGEPDITIRYVKALSLSSSIRTLGLETVGFTDDALLVMRSAHGPRAQIPFEQIGGRCEITCEKNIGRIPLLIPILNLTILSKGIVPLHASAFTYNGTGALVTGWAKGGKTETLIGFMALGAIYVGDEWIYLTEDGRQMFGIPEPIRFWDSHFREMREFRRRLSWRDRARLSLLRWLTVVTQVGMNLVAPAAAPESRLLSLLRRQQYVQVAPSEFFGTSFGPCVGAPDKIFFVVGHHEADVRVEPINALEVARRMLASLQYERLDFTSHYLKFRFAFPDLRNHFIERAEELERKILIRCLADKPAFAVYHPYPAPIPAMVEAISPFLSQASERNCSNRYRSDFDVIGQAQAH